MTLRIIILIIFIVIFLNESDNIFAQDDFQSFIEKVSENNIEGYIEPSVIAFGSAINSGLFHTGKVHKVGGFDVSIKGMAVFIPDKAKTFSANIPGNQSQIW